MVALFNNNAFSTLASGITDVATSLTVAAADGALFPNPVAPDYFYATLIDTSNNVEIIKVTARSTDVLTIVRAQEGTSGTAFSTADRIELRITAAVLTELGQWTKGADVASGTALPVLTDGNYFDVTGTTTITSIDSMSVTPGVQIKLHFDGALTLTHHATNLILPGGANITTAAGDEAEFVEYASGDYRCTSYLGAGTLSNIVEDTTPQLGGDLDLNGQNIDFPTTANISDCLDEDTMSSDSATVLATQQSIKAYADGLGLATANFTSAEQTVTFDTALDIVHGLSGIPRLWQVVLRCAATDVGYAAGDEVFMTSYQGTIADTGVTMFADATNISIIQGSAISLLNKGSFNSGTITVTKWKWVARAWV